MATRTLLLGVALLLTGACHTDSGDRLPYPPTRTVDVVDDYHGTKVADPFRWLEDTTPEVRDWAVAQTQFGRPFLNDTTLRERLRARLLTLDAAWESLDSALGAADPDPIHLEGGRLVIAGASAAPRLLLDPATFGPSMRIARILPAPDGRHVLVEIAEGGDDWKTGRVVRVADGALMADSIPRLLFEQPTWMPDSKGLLIVQYIHPGNHERVMLRGGSLSYHRLGSTSAEDRVIVQLAPDDVEGILEVQLTGQDRFALISDGTGADFDGLGWAQSRLSLLPLEALTNGAATSALVPITTSRDAAYTIVSSDTAEMLVLTDQGAPRHRVVAIRFADPAPAKWREVIPASDDVLMQVDVHGERLVITALRNALPLLRIHGRDGGLQREVTFPAPTRVAVAPSSSSNHLRLETASFLQPPGIIDVDLETGVRTTVLATPIPFPVRDYVEEQQWYVSKDGTRIPMLVVHRKGLALDGSHPTLLFGYGASGTVMLPDYSPEVLAWLEMGGVFALPHLRGGNDFGRAWYEAAILGRKQTTYDDFIAAAEYLIRSGYTAPSKLAIRGVSNGGTLVGAVLAERPELFGAVLAHVPVTDLLRYDRGRHRAQFGTPSDSSQFRFLRATSPLHRIKAGTCYPATLVTTALNDPRSPAWLAMKFTAALQAATSCDHPILLQASALGGHGGDRTATPWLEGALDYLIFAAKTLGVATPP